MNKKRSDFSRGRKTQRQKKENVPTFSKVNEKKLRIIPLGGQEEVGRNMTVFEYDDQIIIVDMGLQFPEEDMPGIDFIVPNTDYLKGKEKNIKAVVFTHGHLDHIGAAPILLKKLGYPPIIGRDLTLAMVKHRLEDYQKGSSKMLKTTRISHEKALLNFGEIKLYFFSVEHSIMDSIGVAVSTPAGTAIHMGDWTLDIGKKEEIKVSYEFLRTLPRPTILMMESLGSLKKGQSVTEEDLWKNFKKVIDEASGRIIIGTFSSQIKRIKDIIEYAGEIGKKVVLDGYSMKLNIEIAKELGYIKNTKDILIDVKEMDRQPENRIIVLCTGAQGEDRAVLSRIITGNHRYIKITKNDTVVFSSSIIPGNERTIQRLKDNFYRKAGNVIHSEVMDVHVSGHNNIEAIQSLIKQAEPDYLVPVYANHYFLKEAKKVAQGIGFPGKNVFILDNGNVLTFSRNEDPMIEKNKVETGYVFVDGLGIGDVGQVVLRDRQMLSQDGMFVVTVLVDSKTKEIIGNIQVTSRGFIYVKENFDLVNATKRVVKKVIEQNTSSDTSINWELLKKNIRDEVGLFLFKKTERRPMVLPVVIEV